MKKINENKEFINIQAYKYDGTFYRQWNGARIIGSTKDYVAILLNKTKVQELKNQKWIIAEPIIWFFYLNNFFNVTLTIKEGEFYYYANLSSPFFMEDNTIKYIDYDYDIKQYPGKRFTIVDHNDFLNNKKWYDEDTKNVIFKNLIRIAEMSMMKEDIFNEDIIKNIIKKIVALKLIDKKHFPNIFSENFKI